MASTQSIELARRGQEFYERELQSKLELTNPNAFVAIETESGDYFVGQTLSEAIQAARAVYPDRLPFVVRVGHRATIEMGGLTQ